MLKFPAELAWRVHDFLGVTVAVVEMTVVLLDSILLWAVFWTREVALLSAPHVATLLTWETSDTYILALWLMSPILTSSKAVSPFARRHPI